MSGLRDELSVGKACAIQFRRKPFNSIGHRQPQPQQKHRPSQQTTSDKHVHCCQHNIFSTQHCYNTQKQLTWSSNWEPLTYEPVISRSLFIVAMNQSSAPADWSKTTVRRREDGGVGSACGSLATKKKCPRKLSCLRIISVLVQTRLDWRFDSCADTKYSWPAKWTVAIRARTSTPNDSPLNHTTHRVYNRRCTLEKTQHSQCWPYLNGHESPAAD